MTQEEFINTRYCKFDKVIYQNIEYPIIEIDFEEMMFGIRFANRPETEWVTCESCTYIPNNN